MAPATATCVLADAPRIVATASHVVVVVFDTLRADVLGAWGDPRDLSPNIDSLAAQGMVWESAVALSSWTKPSVTTVLSSVSPADHEVGYLDSTVPPELPWLPEILARHGMATAAFVANPVLPGEQGFARGFDGYRMDAEADTRETLRRAAEWLDPERRQFLYVHVMGPHGPYRAPITAVQQVVREDCNDVAARQYTRKSEAWYQWTSIRDLDCLRALYAARLKAEDAELGVFLDALAAKGLAERTLLVFLGDHGEAFFEHGRMEHGNNLFHEEIHVPLIFHGPGVEHGRRQELAGLDDVAPTILDLLGIEAPAEFGGRSLRQPTSTAARKRLREFAQAPRPGGEDWYGIIDNGFKAVWSTPAGARYLFADWKHDEAGADRAASDPARFAELQSAWQRERTVTVTAPPAPLTDGQREALEALGYLD